MGEVYRARDTRLDRTVAIKVLPPGVADNPDLRARFDREARAISSLNHPNICTLHDVGHQDGIDFLVMEYIEGKTLAERLTEGPLSAQELLTAAIQIADALDKAHRQGLVHRDLKPGNIMLTQDGAKLLDFGLAKLQIPEDATAAASGITRTTPLTGEGTILGTIQYMAPEQLEGREADGRSDIFAFGAILYEMATGVPAFAGSGRASLIASIMKETPRPLSQVQPMSPPMLERVVSQCLEKDPDHRWQTAGDLKRSLQWIADGGSQAGLPVQVATRRKLISRLAWVAAVTATAVAAVFAWFWFSRDIPEPNLLRFKISTRTDISQVSWPCLSPDGQYLAFKAVNPEGKDMIWIRPLNSLEAYPLSGTEDANRPFWSPDSKYLAFIENRRQLKKIPVGGGPAQLICETARGADGTWGSAGYIIYDAGPGDSLFVVAASGGTPTPLLGIDKEAGEVTHSWPWFLPDGEHYLYLAEMGDRSKAGGNYLLRVGNIKTREAVTVFPVDARVQYCEPGYLVYFRNGILLAQKFDPNNFEVTGEAVPLTDEVGVGEADRAEFGLSDQGTLAYQTTSSVSLSKLVWVDRSGTEESQIGESASIDDIFLSPDESKLSLCIFDGDQTDIWVYDLDRDVKTRVTFGDAQDISPLWSADGKHVYYSNNETGIYAIYRKAASGVGEATLVYKNDSLHAGVSSRSPDGRWLYGQRVRTNWNIVRFDLTDTLGAEKIVATPYFERGAAASPDGHYLAYYGSESGQPEVYVLELGEGGGRWQISSGGGRYPQWSPRGDELYYITPNWDFMAVPIKTTDGFSVGKPVKLFNKRLSTEGLGAHRYAATSDPNAFIILTPLAASVGGEFTVVVNWQKEMEGR